MIRGIYRRLGPKARLADGDWRKSGAPRRHRGFSHLIATAIVIVMVLFNVSPAFSQTCDELDPTCNMSPPCDESGCSSAGGGTSGSSGGSTTSPPSQVGPSNPGGVVYGGDPLQGNPTAGQVDFVNRFTRSSSDVLATFERDIGAQPVPHIPAIIPLLGAHSGGVVRMVSSNGRLPVIAASSGSQIPAIVPHTEPVASDGEFVVDETDLTFPGDGVPFVFARHYRSGVDYQSSLGFGWNHSFNQHLLVDKTPMGSAASSRPDIFLIDDRLQQVDFIYASTSADGFDVYRADAVTALRLSHRTNVAGAIWTLEDGSNQIRVFDATHGNLIRIQDYAGHAIKINWDNADNLPGIFWNAAKPKITSVVDTTGRTIYFNYSSVSLAQMPIADLIGEPGKKSGLFWSGWGGNDTGAEFLKCLSLATDCSSPLVSFSVAFKMAYSPDLQKQISRAEPAGWFIEFDLVAVHDSNNNGPSYRYPIVKDPATGSTLAYQKSFSGYWPSQYAQQYYSYVNDHIADYVALCPQIVSAAITDVMNLSTDCTYLNCTVVAFSPRLWAKLVNGCKQNMPKDIKALSSLIPSKRMYGIPPQLSHDITDIYDAAGRQIVHNDYESDSSSPGFDRVKTQVLGQDTANTTNYRYVDYWYAPSINRPAFDPVNICPSTSDGFGPASVLANKDRDASQSPMLELVRSGPLNRTYLSFYDAAGRPLREVTPSNRATNYNYGTSGVTGALLPSGRRTCLTYDGFGKPVGIAFLAAPSRPGPTLIETFSYDAAEQLTGHQTKVAGAEQSNEQIVRDASERVTAVGKTVDAQHVLWTCYHYTDTPVPLGPIISGIRRRFVAGVDFSLPGVGPILPFRLPCASSSSSIVGLASHRASLPDVIINPDESEVHLVGLTPTGPSDVITDAKGASPVDRYFTYDDNGRVNGTGLRDGVAGQVIPASVESWSMNVEGLVQTRHQADQSDGSKSVDVAYAYDSSWRLQTVDGPLTTFSYTRDALGRVTSMLAVPKGGTGATGQTRATCLTYDPYGNVIERISPQGIVTDYGYNGDDSVVQITTGPLIGLDFRPAGATALSPCTPQTVGLRLATSNVRETVGSFEYDADGLPTYSSSYGERFWYSYDGQGRIIDIAVPDTSFIAANGKKQTVLRHLARGFNGFNLAWQAILDPSPNANAMPPYPLPKYLSEGLYAAAEYQYDELGRQTQLTRWQFIAGTPPVAEQQPYATTTHVYDDAHDLEDVTSEVGAVSEIRRDGSGRVTSIAAAKSDPAQVQTRIAYARAGLDATFVTTPSAVPGGSFVGSVSRSPDGQVLNVVEQGTSVQSATLDPVGRLLALTRMGAGTRTFDYDAFNDVIGVQEINGDAVPVRMASLSWDRDGDLTTTTDGAGRQISRSYDTGGRLLSLTSGLGVTTYNYMPGTLSVGSITSAAGKISFSYDAGGKLAGEIVADAVGRDAAGTLAFAYDPLGNLTLATTETSGTSTPRTVSVVYDSIGRGVSETSSDSATFVRHDFAQRSDTVSVASPNSSAVIRRLFDALGRPSSIGSNGSDIARYGYIGYDLQSIAYANHLTQTLGFDALGRRVSEDVAGPEPGGVGFSRSYGEDGIPHRSDLTIGGAGVATGLYATDASGRLQAEENFSPALPQAPGGLANSGAISQMDGGAARYLIDVAGNWLSRSGAFPLTLTSDNANRYATLNGTAVSNMPQAGANGLLGTAYRWDGLNRISMASTATHSLKGTFDGLGRLVMQTDEQGASTKLIWDGGTLLGSIPSSGDGPLLALGFPGLTPAALSRSGQVSTFLHASSDGSVFGITGSAGQLLQAVSYSAFGMPTLWGADGKASNTFLQSPFLFQGAYYSPTLGSYWMGSRTYRPDIGRFLEPDPVGAAGGLNLFAFADNQPLTRIDPEGTMSSRPGAQASDSAYTPWSQTLTSDEETDAWRNSLQDAVGSNRSVMTRLGGMVGTVMRLPLVVGEKVDNAVGAFAGNVYDQNFLRGAGRFYEADRAADYAGERIMFGLFAGGGAYALGTMAVGGGSAMTAAGTTTIGANPTVAPNTINAISNTRQAAAGAVDQLGTALSGSSPRYGINNWTALGSSISNARIGVPYETLEEAAASGGGHQAEIELSRNGQLIDRWFESSHTGDGFGGHTEQKALSRIMDYVNQFGAKGIEVIIYGYYAPCPYGHGCMNTMQYVADKYKMMIEYLSANGAVYRFVGGQ